MQTSRPWAATRWRGRRRGWRRGWLPWLADGLMLVVCASAIAGKPADWFGPPAPAGAGPVVVATAQLPAAAAMPSNDLPERRQPVVADD